MAKPRLVLLNAFPLNAFTPFKLLYVIFQSMTPEEFRRTALQRDIVCYIRHPGTVRVLAEYLNRDLKPSRDLYTYNPLDEIAIVTLRHAARGKEVEELSIEDLAFVWVIVTDRVA
ncbi:MAG: hypothetical protein DRJ67_06365 [Thermoprotei archaeon]|nr:MAG: hypothetical protein DRJ67_06365 [Thermoprotei archaeon]